MTYLPRYKKNSIFLTLICYEYLHVNQWFHDYHEILICLWNVDNLSLEDERTDFFIEFGKYLHNLLYFTNVICFWIFLVTGTESLVQ